GVALGIELALVPASAAAAGERGRPERRELEEGSPSHAPRIMPSSLGPVRMTQAQWNALVEHAREAAPNECCGYLTARDGGLEEVVRAENVYESPRYGYEVDPKSMLTAWKLSEEGREMGIYHSHPRSAAEPSQA